jgi:hypothetical protein
VDGCEMDEGVKGIHRARKQWMSGPKGHKSGTITQRSKGCLVCLGITQQSIQKVADVQYFLEYVYCTIHILRCTIC